MLPQRKNLLRRNAWYRQQLLLNTRGADSIHPHAVRAAADGDRSTGFASNEEMSCAASPSPVERTAAPAV